MKSGVNGVKTEDILNADHPQVFMVQETKLKRKNQIRIEKYDLFEKVRKTKGGGWYYDWCQQRYDRQASRCEPSR